MTVGRAKITKITYELPYEGTLSCWIYRYNSTCVSVITGNGHVVEAKIMIPLKQFKGRISPFSQSWMLAH